jgi:hypothetical protein
MGKRYNADQFILLFMTNPLEIDNPVAFSNDRYNAHLTTRRQWNACLAHGKAQVKEERTGIRAVIKATEEEAKAARKAARVAAREVLAALAGETVSDRVARQWEASMRKSKVVPVEVEENERQRWAAWGGKQAGKSSSASAFVLAFDEIDAMTRSAMLLSERPQTAASNLRVAA